MNSLRDKGDIPQFGNSERQRNINAEILICSGRAT